VFTGVVERGTLQVLIDREHMRWEFREIILFKQA
jgi:hypothetical protein